LKYAKTQIIISSLLIAGISASFYFKLLPLSPAVPYCNSPKVVNILNKIAEEQGAAMSILANNKINFQFEDIIETTKTDNERVCTSTLYILGNNKKVVMNYASFTIVQKKKTFKVNIHNFYGEKNPDESIGKNEKI